MAEIPVLKIGDCLLVSIQVDMHDRLAMELQDDLTNRIVSERARGVMIDISALEIVDSFIGRMLNNIAAMSRVLDAVTVVVGMRPPTTAPPCTPPLRARRPAGTPPASRLIDLSENDTIAIPANGPQPRKLL